MKSWAIVEVAVKAIEKFTPFKRTAASVVTMDKVIKPYPNIPVKKAACSNCFDGDVLPDAGTN